MSEQEAGSANRREHLRTVPVAAGAEEVRVELARIVASAVFRDSPRLAAFLRFVVNAELEGNGDRIKGYTIAVEALGRDADFDPQSDPIVRVEARRLRDALARYYAGVGRDDPLVIELPRGGYVPAFHRQPHRVPAHMAAAEGRSGRAAASIVAGLRRHAKFWRYALYGIGLLAVLEVLFDIDRPFTGGPNAGLLFPLAPSGGAAPSPSRRSTITPVIYVEPLIASGTPAPTSISATMFRERLIDALARFDDVTVIDAPPRTSTSAAGPDYRVVIAAHYNVGGSVSIAIKLRDASDNTIAWSKTYESGDGAYQSQSRMIGDGAIEWLQPFGVIQARERIKRALASTMDDPYRCMLDAYSYLRSFDVAQYRPVRACLERAAADSPEWVTSFEELARLDLREYQFGITGRPGDARALDRALETVTRAVDVKPTSALAQCVLQNVLMARGDLEGARAAGERSLRLNPNDRTIVFSHAFLLIALGEIDEGATLIRLVASDSLALPGRYHPIVGLAAYLKGDLAAAAVEVSRITNPHHPLGLMLSVLVAAKTGERARAQEALELLYVQDPSWRTDPRAGMGRFLPVSPTTSASRPTLPPPRPN